MEDYKKILVLYKLKEVYRVCHVPGRRESSAEHTWGCMLLADYFLCKMDLKLNRNRVMDILLYHELVEVEAGDTPVIDKEALKTKAYREKIGFEALKEKMPQELVAGYSELYKEYKECKTPEAKFANAIDKLDPIIHSLEHPEAWKEWDLSEADVREHKERHLLYSEEFMKVLNELIEYLKDNDFIKH